MTDSTEIAAGWWLKVRGGDDPELVTKIKETMTKLTNNLGTVVRLPNVGRGTRFRRQ